MGPLLSTGHLASGNHTNNFAEAGIKILKEIVFSRVKAYNLVQIFHFLTDTMEAYYCRKLLSVSNNRLDTYIALRFQGLNAAKVPKDSIKEIDGTNKVFHVRSTTQRDVVYTVDMVLGVCSCPQGSDGSPCTHQAAISLHCGTPSINCVPTLVPEIRRVYAQIALGNKAATDISFYAGLRKTANARETTHTEDSPHPDFSSPTWDFIRAGAQEDDGEGTGSNNYEQEDTQDKIEELCCAIDQMTEDLKQRVREAHDEQIRIAVGKFTSRYNKLCKVSTPQLTSALHRFGWVFGGSVTNMKGGQIRHGRRIAVQATAAGRRRRGIARGSARAIPGKPAGGSAGLYNKENSRYILPTRRQSKGKRPHSLNLSVSQGHQNAGKW